MMKKILLFFVSFILCFLFIISFNKEKDKDFWEEPNCIRLITGSQFSIILSDTLTDDKIDYEFEIPEQYLKQLESLKLGIQEFILLEYNIDVSQKLASQKIGILKSSEENNYVDLNSNIIYLNKAFFSEEYGYLLNSYFLITTFQYLGVMSSNMLSPIDMGMCEYLSKKCSEYLNIDYFSFYSEYRKIAIQMCTVNEKFIIHKYLENNGFDISEHLSEILSDVKFSHLKTSDIGNFESSIMYLLEDSDSQDSFSDVIYFTVQEICACYCKCFEPSEKEIDIIRQNYIFDIENVDIKYDYENDHFYLN